MAGVTPVDALLTGSSTTPAQGTVVDNGVKTLMATSGSADALFKAGANASQNLTQAQTEKAQADKEQADTVNAYVKSNLNASGINSGLMETQAENNKQLNTVVQAASTDLTKNIQVLNDDTSGFWDKFAALFKVSKGKAELAQLAGVQALQNQQTTNTINLNNAIGSAIVLKAQDTTQAQRDATAKASVAQSEFDGSQNLLKLKSQQIQMQSQVLQQAMSASELKQSQMRMGMLSEQIKEHKESKAEISGAVQDFNTKFGTKLTPAAFALLPQEQQILLIQNHSGAMPVQKPTDTVATLNAMGVNNDVIEKAYPGILGTANNYQAAEQRVDALNAAQGAKPTKEQREAQVANEVQKGYKAQDTTILSAGMEDPANPSPIWAGVPKAVMDVIKPIVVDNADAMKNMGTDGQFQLVADKLYQQDTKQSATQLASKLNYIYEATQKNATRQLQSQGVANSGFGLNVQQYKTGFFGQEGSTNEIIQTPAQMLNYAASVIKKNQQRIIEQGSQIGKTGYGYQTSTSTGTGLGFSADYANAMKQQANRIKSDLSK